MPRGNAQIAKVHYKGSTDDFIVFVDSADDLKAWKEDKSIPLAQVVGSFKIMVTDKYVGLDPNPNPQTRTQNDRILT